MLSIYLLRHAETDYNANNQFIGGRSTHWGLSTKGEKQTKEIGELLNQFDIQIVYFHYFTIAIHLTTKRRRGTHQVRNEGTGIP